MSRSGKAVLIGIAVVALVAVAVPFTRDLIFGAINGEPIDGDLRPLSYHIERLNDPDPIIVGKALGRIGVMKAKGAAAIPEIVKVGKDQRRGSMKYRDDTTSTLRRLAMVVLRGMGPDAAPAVPDLLEFLFHDDQLTRMEAAETLRVIGEASLQDLRPITAALKDSWGAVRKPIALLLLDRRPEVLREQIKLILASQESPPDLRSDASEWAEKLGRSGR